MLSMNCTTINLRTDPQTRQAKSYVNKDLRINLLTEKDKHKVNHFIAGPGKEADMEVSAKLTWEMHNDYNDISLELAASTVCSY